MGPHRSFYSNGMVLSQPIGMTFRFENVAPNERLSLHDGMNAPDVRLTCHKTFTTRAKTAFGKTGC